MNGYSIVFANYNKDVCVMSVTYHKINFRFLSETRLKGKLI